MRLYEAFLRKGRAPLLLRDGFSFWAFLFGPFWLLAHGAWIPGVLVFAVSALVAALLHGPAGLVVGLGIAWLVGLYGQELRGWSLRRRGWRQPHVVAARDADTAYARLLADCPDYQRDAAA